MRTKDNGDGTHTHTFIGADMAALVTEETAFLLYGNGYWVGQNGTPDEWIDPRHIEVEYDERTGVTGIKLVPPRLDR